MISDSCQNCGLGLAPIPLLSVIIPVEGAALTKVEVRLAVGEEEKWTMKLPFWQQGTVLSNEADCRIVGSTASGLPILSPVPTQLPMQ